ncbi:MAG: hypothetical protein ACXW3E_04370 [Thermoanaerobaculia bacterium]
MSFSTTEVAAGASTVIEGRGRWGSSGPCPIIVMREVYASSREH